VRAADLAALFLVGGSSRIPLVARMVEQRFGRADTKGDPKTVVALGAAQRLGKQLEAAEAPAAAAAPPPKPKPPRERRPVTPPVERTRSSRKVLVGAVVAALLVGGGVAAAVAGSGGGSDGGATTDGGSSFTQPTETPVETPTDVATDEPTDPVEAVAGDWSGTGEQSGVPVDIELSIDAAGAGDGTLHETAQGNTCGGTLDLDSTDGDSVVFGYTEQENSTCTTGSTVTVTYNQDDGTLDFLDQAEDVDGSLIEVTGTLDPD
jgi:hypothetical protein